MIWKKRRRDCLRNWCCRRSCLSKIPDMLPNFKKSFQICKPDSVLRLHEASVIYLVPVAVPGSALPTPLAPFPPKRNEAVRAAHSQGVHGISTRKVYPPQRLPAAVVRSYHTFSPLPRSENQNAAVIFCDTFYAFPFGKTPSVRRCGALCCPDFPPRKATERSETIFQRTYAL